MPLQIHLLPKKELTVYPVYAESICNFPFHSLNQRDFSTNSRNSNVGVLIEGRTDYSILGNIDPDTHFLSSNNRVISNYYTENEFNQIPNLDTKISIFNVNIRSIPKHFDRLRHYLLELNHNFSVISISETWLKQYNKTFYNIKGYTHVSQIREKRTGGDVSMFINNDIKYDVRDNITIDLPGIDTTCIVIEIPKEELSSSKNTIVLTDVNPKSFIEKLADVLQYLHSLHKDVFIVGDFSINVAEAMLITDSTVSEFHNMFLSYYFHPLINKPTRVNGNKASTIDNIYTNISYIPPSVSGIFKTSFSDHYSIFVLLILIKCKAKVITKREFSNNNIREFSKALSSYNWESLYTMNTFEQSFSYFYSIFLDIFNANIPLKTIQLKYKNRISF